MPYLLGATLPAGAYAVAVAAFQPSKDAQLKVELVHRAKGGHDRTFAAATFDNQATPDGGLTGDINGLIPNAPAIAAACGDHLVLRFTLLSGSSPYADFNATLTTP